MKLSLETLHVKKGEVLWEFPFSHPQPCLSSSTATWMPGRRQSDKCNSQRWEQRIRTVRQKTIWEHRWQDCFQTSPGMKLATANTLVPPSLFYLVSVRNPCGVIFYIVLPSFNSSILWPELVFVFLAGKPDTVYSLTLLPSWSID